MILPWLVLLVKSQVILPHRWWGAGRVTHLTGRGMFKWKISQNLLVFRFHCNSIFYGKFIATIFKILVMVVMVNNMIKLKDHLTSRVFSFHCKSPIVNGRTLAATLWFLVMVAIQDGWQYLQAEHWSKLLAFIENFIFGGRAMVAIFGISSNGYHPTQTEILSFSVFQYSIVNNWYGWYL